MEKHSGVKKTVAEGQTTLLNESLETFRQQHDKCYEIEEKENHKIIDWVSNLE